MDRTITYPGAIPLDTDILQPQQYAEIAVGYLAQMAMGTGATTVVSGLGIAQTTVASMAVVIGAGCIASSQPLEANAYGSVAADTTDTLVKIGMNLSPQSFTLTAPATAGQSINYLIQASFAETDTGATVLPYYNAASPSVPYTGPGGSGTAQNTRRVQRAALQLKVGFAAAAGSQTTPAVDTGWTGLYVITVNYGQTQITTANLASGNPNVTATMAGAPFLAGLLNSHHGGVPGQAPKINLATEVQGILPLAALANISGKLLNIVTATGTGIYTPTAGTNRVLVFAVGGGGGGGGSDAPAAGQAAPAPGGSAGTLGIGFFSSGFAGASIVIGGGGAGGAAGPNSGAAGGTTSFGSLLTAPGGLAGTGGSAQTASGGILTGSISPGGQATGGLLSICGNPGGPGWVLYYGATSGAGGSCLFGTGAPAVGANSGGMGAAQYGYGGAGSGALSVSGGGAHPGGAGAPGLVWIWEFS